MMMMMMTMMRADVERKVCERESKSYDEKFDSEEQ
jgi:hypothetical protein